MKIKRNLGLLFFTGFLAASSIPAFAMGTGNPYADGQDGLNYVVYQPSFLDGLSLRNFGMHKCGAGDLALNVTYVSGKKSIYLTESSVKNICPMTMMLVRGAIRTVVTKPGADNLTATQVVTISNGISRAEINSFFSHLIPRYTAAGSKVVEPILVDPTIVKDTNVSLKNIVIFVVPDPSKWSATVADPKIVSFVIGNKESRFAMNPGLKTLKKGRTIVTLRHNGQKILFNVGVN